jgi:hypothetical protein
VIVPVEEAPPTTEPGLSETESADTGFTVKVVFTDSPSYVAVTVSTEELSTPNEKTGNVAVDCPAGTVTEAWRERLEEDESATTVPPAGAT